LVLGIPEKALVSGVVFGLGARHACSSVSRQTRGIEGRCHLQLESCVKAGGAPGSAAVL
jgi:hypothetical protein